MGGAEKRAEAYHYESLPPLAGVSDHVAATVFADEGRGAASVVPDPNDAVLEGMMTERKYSMLDDDWEVDEGATVFTSPRRRDRARQTIIFGERLKNGSVSADITILENLANDDHSVHEAHIIVRYAGADECYYGGTGGFDAKFFIGKVLPGPIFQPRQWIGDRKSVIAKKKYRLRVDFNGSQVTLFENDVQQLVLIDENYPIGQWGIGTYKTRARFENVVSEKAKTRAFVVMPFASQLEYVHAVIKRTIESYGIQCERADEIMVSRPVMDDVKSCIAAADLVIVDFTGRNPNVYYEAGLADALKKHWIVLAQAEDDLTFDVRHIRAIRYSNTMGANELLEANLRKAIEALGYAPE